MFCVLCVSGSHVCSLLPCGHLLGKGYDSSLFYAAARLSDIAGIINHDLIMLSNWAIQWLVKFNPLKTEAVLFTLKYLKLFLN